MNQLEKLKNEIENSIFIYDIEVFAKYWCVSFYDIKQKQMFTIENDFFILSQFVKTKLKNALVGGFNNNRYDDWILRLLLSYRNPYRLSQWIINKRKNPWDFENISTQSLPFVTFDISYLPGTGKLPLKKYEAFLGLKILESTVSFDKTTQLSPTETKEIKEYNQYDVKATAFLFLKYVNNFLIKCNLINAYNLSVFELKKTTAQLTAKIFKANPKLLPYYATYTYQAPENIKKLFNEVCPSYLWILEKFENTTYHTEFSPQVMDDFEISITIDGLNYIFGLGGLHAALECYKNEKSKIITLDIFSNYPNLISKYNYGSRRAPQMASMIADILVQRTQAKKVNDEIKVNYLKELLVTPFGAMEYRYNDLWDAKQRMSICITGQIIIFIYAMLLSKICKVIQVNTDGVFVEITNREQLSEIDKITQYWQVQTMMQIEKQEFSQIIQKDVNNYILVKDINDQNTWKAKGGMLKHWNTQFNQSTYQDARGSKNNNLTAIDEAVVMYLVKEIPPMQTLKNIKELIRFQFVFEKKGKYEDVYLGDQKQPKLKVYRMFYTTNGQPAFKTWTDSDGNIRREKIANSSERTMIYNQDIRTKTTDFLPLDYEYYELLAWNRIELFYKQNRREAFKQFYPGEQYECTICSQSLMQELTVRTKDGMEVCKNCYFKKKTEI
ncbi:hypothetical protein BCF59_0509 [Mycoplasmopsis mustelae]|uniref:Uncharacterized protein n=1 Tax=Mycoplasmopsis mustelae TaxID=171289 RepID=A0A4R7UDL2_9BACT|nr:hypothetical protein [Mycoplasmopsis mustelae]TDV23520.1 hypothetical protein BCF59_0509 [Mycoplasmopsis mustelae]